MAGKKGKSKAKKNALYKGSARKEVNKAKRLAKQLREHPNDTSNPLHCDYHSAEAHRQDKDKHEIKHHPSVFDGKPRNHKKKKRSARPMGYLAEVPLFIPEN